METSHLIILITVILLIFSQISYTQEYMLFDHIGLREGLSQSVIASILQDDHGYMWFGTMDGLHKYDGYRFTIYKNNLNDPHSISDSNIIDVCQDSNGNIWVGTSVGGVNRFDPYERG